MTGALWSLSASDMAAGIAAKKFSSRDAVCACLSRIEETNPALNAVTEVLADQALAAADKADQSPPLGPLHGVPVSIKGNIDVAGSATVNGCAAFQNAVAKETSPAAQNLLNAGAIILARTNTPEFCVRWETTNDVYGATKNPWNSALSPGGSSGGAAASIAARMTPLAHGTDLGGSLRHPAQACGVASLRPTKGRVPDYVPSEPEPAMGYQLMNTDGPIARRVADLRLALGVMAAPDHRDPWQVPAPLAQPAPSDLPIAVISNPLGKGIDTQVAHGISKASSVLERSGYDLEYAEPDSLANAVDIWKRTLFFEIFNGLEPAVKDICGPRLRQTFDLYRAATDPISVEDYHAAFGDRRRVLREWMAFFQRYQVIVGPVCTVPPQPVDYDIADVQSTKAAIASMTMLIAINALGLPSVVVPVGIEDGLPQVVQVIGAPFEEMRCLAVAEAIEAHVDPLPIPVF
ncbi:MAG: amidase [Pseudomonadota bacterium]